MQLQSIYKLYLAPWGGGSSNGVPSITNRFSPELNLRVDARLALVSGPRHPHAIMAMLSF